MPRKPRDQLFKKSDVYRLVEAARAKNLPVARIVVTRDGLSLVVGEPEATANSDDNPWDEVLSDAAHKKWLPRHCCWNTDQRGKRRVRFRLRGFSTYLTGTPWSEDFMRQYAAALEGVKAQRSENCAGRTKPGSFNALCVSYYRSPEFRDLKPSTQAVRRNIIEKFRAVHGDKPLKGLGRVHIQQIIGDKAATPEAANNLLKVLRVLLAYAVSLDMIASNPA